MEEKKTAVSLEDFFAAVEGKLARKFPEEWASFQIEVCGKVIELRFDTKEHAQNAKQGLKGKLVRERKAPNAVFKYWVDDCAEYVAPEHIHARWQIHNQDACLAYNPGVGFKGGTVSNKIFYDCHDRKNNVDPLTFAHVLYHSFAQWGRTEGMLLLHSAVIGSDGKGMLIAGRGGAGKSTLSISCLLEGLDFVSDDYVLVTENGPLRAFSIFSSVCLNPDMAYLLKPDMPVLCKMRNGKIILDASSYEIKPQLSIHGILIPVWKDSTKEPCIISVSADAALSRISYSTVAQLLNMPDPVMIRRIITRLTDLPVFEFHTCKDFHKNAEFLRKFIKKEL